MHVLLDAAERAHAKVAVTVGHLELIQCGEHTLGEEGRRHGRARREVGLAEGEWRLFGRKHGQAAVGRRWAGLQQPAAVTTRNV